MYPITCFSSLKSFVLLALLFLVPAKMPVFCIAFGCNYNKRNALEGTSFHRLPLSKPSLLKQVKNFFNGVCLLILVLSLALH